MSTKEFLYNKGVSLVINKIQFRCRKCNKLLFNYISGDLHIEMKCERCKRVLTFKNYEEKYVRMNSKNGIFRV